MGTGLLELRGVDKSFGKVRIAADLNLSVPAGQTVGIVGPNGAGKSSLFAIISGDLTPDSGAVWLGGQEITRAAPHERSRAGLGRTFQIPRPFELMTVFENVLVCATSAAGKRRQTANDFAANVLRRTHLLAHANSPAGSLTLLQRKRLEVARALATDPSLLLLDEVAGGLTDPEVAELVDLVRTLQADGMTVVWIEHVVHALTATVDRLICLDGGNIVADGEPDAVLADPVVRQRYLGHAITTGEGAA